MFRNPRGPELCLQSGLFASCCFSTSCREPDRATPGGGSSSCCLSSHWDARKVWKWFCIQCLNFPQFQPYFNKKLSRNGLRGCWGLSRQGWLAAESVLAPHFSCPCLAPRPQFSSELHKQRYIDDYFGLILPTYPIGICSPSQRFAYAKFLRKEEVNERQVLVGGSQKAQGEPFPNLDEALLTRAA